MCGFGLPSPPRDSADPHYDPVSGDAYSAITAHGVIEAKPIEGSRVYGLSLTALAPRLILRRSYRINSARDVFILGPIGSRNDWLTVTFKPALQLTTGCFSGSIEQFEAEVLAKRGPPNAEEYEAALVLIRVLAEWRCPKEEA